MSFNLPSRCAITLAGLFFLALAAHADEFDLINLSLQELLSVKVTSASMTEQNVNEAPARVEVITAEDLRRRGYKDLSYIFEDITGIAVTRTFGDNYFNVFWRGVRHTVGNSMLLLLDGNKLNHLYTNESEIIAALPINAIERVEIVYGPASVLYGSDAVVGIVNIVTRQDAGLELTLETGSNQKRTADLYWQHTGKAFSWQLAARWNQGNTDFRRADQYLWTNPELIRDTRIWGEWANAYGQLKSAKRQRAIDLSLKRGNSEIRYLFAEISSGYGLEYTFDHVLPNSGPWLEPTTSVSWKHKFEQSERFWLLTELRYLNTSFDSRSQFVEGYLSQDATGNPIRLTDFSYWQSKNRSRTLKLRSYWQVKENVNWINGFEFEHRNLQKAYNINFGPALPPELVDLDNYPFPAIPDGDVVADNRKNISKHSFYSLLQYELPNFYNSSHTIHMGLRLEENSEYSVESNIRAGYVGNWPEFTMKLFYGEAFQDPPARLLYGAWQGSGADPDLKPRDADTLELNMDWMRQNWSVGLNLYDMQSNNLFNTIPGGAINSGLGESRGGDIRVIYRNERIELVDLLKFRAGFSWVRSKEQLLDDNNNLVWEPVGDVAEQMFHFGLDVDVNERWNIGLRGRWYAPRKTIKSNPVDEVDSLAVLDLSFDYHPPRKNWQLHFAIDNLTDALVFHPGVRSAGASLTPGFFNSDGVWIGSGDFYNSKIVQPGREYRLQFTWKK